MRHARHAALKLRPRRHPGRRCSPAPSAAAPPGGVSFSRPAFFAPRAALSSSFSSTAGGGGGGGDVRTQRAGLGDPDRGPSGDDDDDDDDDDGLPFGGHDYGTPDDLALVLQDADGNPALPLQYCGKLQVVPPFDLAAAAAVGDTPAKARAREQSALEALLDEARQLRARHQGRLAGVDGWVGVDTETKVSKKNLHRYVAAEAQRQQRRERREQQRQQQQHGEAEQAAAAAAAAATPSLREQRRARRRDRRSGPGKRNSSTVAGHLSGGRRNPFLELDLPGALLPCRNSSSAAKAARPKRGSGRKHGVAPPPTTLLQLATRRNAIIYRLDDINHMSEYLLNFLSDPRILKCGAGVENDLSTLMYERGEIDTIEGCLDMDALVQSFPEFRRVRVHEDPQQPDQRLVHGLQSLSELLLAPEHVPWLRQRVFKKNKRVAMSDWSACPLSEEQVAYACTDAWLGFEFLDALLDRQPDAMQSRDALPGLSAFRAGYTTKPDDPAKTQAQGLIHSRNRAVFHTRPHTAGDRLVRKPPSVRSRPRQRQQRLQPYQTMLEAFDEDTSITRRNSMTLTGLRPDQRFDVHVWVNARPNMFSFSTPAATATAAADDGSTDDDGKEAFTKRVHLYRVTDTELEALQSAISHLEGFVSEVVNCEEVQKQSALTIPLLSKLSSWRTTTDIDVPLAILTSLMENLIAQANRTVLSGLEWRLFRRASAANKSVLAKKNVKFSLDRGSSDEVCVVSLTHVDDETLNISAVLRDQLNASE